MISTPAHRRILVVHTGHGPLRGSEKVVIRLIELLSPAYRFALFTNHEALAKELAPHTAKAILEPTLDDAACDLSKPRTALRLIWRLARLMKEQEIDLVHVNNGHATRLVHTATILRPTPILTHLHAPLSRRTQIRLGIYSADQIVGVAAFLGDVWSASPRIRRKIRTIYNAVDEAVVPDEAMRYFGGPTTQRPFTMATASVLTEAKGVDMAIEAVRRLQHDGRTVRLLILGSGPEDQHLRRIAEGLPVEFLGYRTDAISIIAAADALLLPSRRYEAHSIALLEAGVAGVARIAADIPGSQEVITHGETGLLFRSGNVNDLAARIAVLMDDPTFACRLGAAGRNDVLQRFSSERFRCAFQDAYREVMALRPSRLGRLASLPVEAVAVLASLQAPRVPSEPVSRKRGIVHHL